MQMNIFLYLLQFGLIQHFQKVIPCYLQKKPFMNKYSKFDGVIFNTLQIFVNNNIYYNNIFKIICIVTVEIHKFFNYLNNIFQISQLHCQLL